MHVLKLTQVSSIALILPKEVLASLKLEEGDMVLLTGTPDGLVVTPSDASLQEQIDAGRAFMREFRDTFHALAN